MPLTIAIMMQLSQQVFCQHSHFQIISRSFSFPDNFHHSLLTLFQLSGINAVFYYSTNLFITTGLSETSAKYATIGIGSVMVLMTLVSIPLMDRLMIMIIRHQET